MQEYSPSRNDPKNNGEMDNSSFLLRQISRSCAENAQKAHKNLIINRIRLAFTVLIGLILVGICLFYLPRLSAAMEKTQTALSQLQTITSSLSLEGTQDILAQVEELTNRGKESLSSIEEAAKVIERIDVDKLNAAIEALEKATSVLSRMFG